MIFTRGNRMQGIYDNIHKITEVLYNELMFCLNVRIKFFT